MNDDEFQLPEGFRLVGIVGGLRPQAGVKEEPSLTLLGWRAVQFQGGDIHLIGHCIELAEGRASTPVVAGDAAARQCVTRSGRLYALQGSSGNLDSDADWVWEQFKLINGLVNGLDVSDQLFELLPKSQPKGEYGR